SRCHCSSSERRKRRGPERRGLRLWSWIAATRKKWARSSTAIKPFLAVIRVPRSIDSSLHPQCLQRGEGFPGLLQRLLIMEHPVKSEAVADGLGAVAPGDRFKELDKVSFLPAAEDE